MQWNDYRLVLAVARARKLPEAADALGLTVSTMFRRIERIEDLLEEQVFIRERGIYTPNEIGAELCRAAERMEQETFAAERKVLGTSSLICGTLTVTSSEVLGAFFLSRHMTELSTRHPGLKVQLHSGNEVLSLANRQADVALRPARPTDSNLFGRKLSDIRWAVYGDAQGRARFATSSDFSGERFIGFSGNPLAERMSAIHRAEFPDGTVSTTTNSLILTAASAQQGRGLAILPMILGEQWPGLFRLSEPIEKGVGELWIVCHEGMRNNSRVRIAFDALIAGVEQDRTLFVGDADQLKPHD
ncbi:MAG: LysR family transcriptional regulator [Paracoccaceae bacterium]|uniref:LysR family transcriptional regulator n=2 Tax=Rhodobacterales TaxID=204455 RepID=UPI003298AF56